MAGPAFQLIDDRFSGGEYGISAYGTSPYGGPGALPYELPLLQVPADDLTDVTRKAASRITHKRYGAIIGRRTVSVRRRWLVSFDAVGRDVIDGLDPFFEAGRFKLLPNGDSSSEIIVDWLEDEFLPERKRGPYWNIQFTIEEAES